MNHGSDFETYLRTSLTQALRKEHLGRLCKSEPSDATHIATLLSHGLVWSMLASLAFWLFVRFQLDIPQAAGIVVGFLLLLTIFAAVTKRFQTAALLIVAAWSGTAIESYLGGGIGTASATHLLPFALIAVGVWMWRALSLAASIPYLLPVAFVVVFLPLLTQDLWQIGDSIDTQLIAVAAVAPGPLVLFLVIRYLNTNVDDQFEDALVELRNNNPALKAQLLETLKEAPRETATTPAPDEWLWGKLVDIYQGSGANDQAVHLGQELKTTFRRHIVFRLARLTIGTGALFGVFVFGLAWAAVPISVSSQWIDHSIETTTIELPGWSFTIPISPYVEVAALLSIVATAAFLAFALTEDRYATALSSVVVRRPAERCVMLGVPYRALYSPQDGPT